MAHTSRNFIAFAEQRNLPLLCVRAGNRSVPLHQSGSVRTLELPRSRLALGVEKDLSFDPLFWRHADTIEAELRRFKPDLLHLTGPSELGLFAAYFSWKLHIPLAASWHTNVHEYASQRLRWVTRHLPGRTRRVADRALETAALAIATRFYSRAEMLFAPNPELCAMLSARTGQPCSPMPRGVDAELFNSAKRTRTLQPGSAEEPFLLGFVGRLSIEKNVALLPVLQQQLTAAGLHVRFVIVGHGSEEESLRNRMPGAILAGVLRNEELARVYANMDLLVFPSHTDTFGNVVLEALASGVPAIVTADGGPKFIVEDGVTGAVAHDSDFPDRIAAILRQPGMHRQMRQSARKYALTCQWNEVFERIYQAYETRLAQPDPSLLKGRGVRVAQALQSLP